VGTLLPRLCESFVDQNSSVPTTGGDRDVSLSHYESHRMAQVSKIILRPSGI
jgi:hypothetical protein